MPKKQSDAEKLAALLGIEPPSPTISDTESPAEISRQAEAALAYSSGHGFIRKDCQECGLKFAHTPGAVAYCSDTCRAAALLKIGIKWHWDKDRASRWAPVEEPLVVPPEALVLVDAAIDVYDHLKCPVHNHMRDTPEHGAWCWERDPITNLPVPLPSEPAKLSDDLVDKLKALGIS